MTNVETFSTQLAQDGDEITDSALDLGKLHLTTVSARGVISMFKRIGWQDDWIKEFSWKCPETSLSKVCWADPINGLMLAVGSRNGRISIWSKPCSVLAGQQSNAGIINPSMQSAGELSLPGQIVGMEFAPRHHGLWLATVSTDQVSVFRPSPKGSQSWQLEHSIHQRRGTPFTGLCWRPSAGNLAPMLLTASHSEAKIWEYREESMSWQAVSTVHNAGVSCIAWARSANHPKELIAVGSKTAVKIKGLSRHATQTKVEEIACLDHPSTITKVGWHPMSSWLAVSLSNSEVHLWRANLVGEWQLLRRLVPSIDCTMVS